ncbi:tRNA (N(6)-L-threonylcarbamoyladenosine(37)-C(2))-methylthiotransferase MtaB [Ehrlichia ruminantium]|uniref:tRNA (N(6)-L-threonylcarbamoyladenosine(37)-C(2))-methylthiotransferase MtaB n=1 Tax=Ehrlichia ruminantium TaxID=779 RepID=A0AAE6UIS8_EHRRU|nr:tRNA (N(6)-L-threonylcarbamoyladenosine(37)-C(2))-methylthiotransferase MtaB [Ehrlichia ruminantium]QGR02821.1 tRNA (N(6)-L-threonylcarbamoyladenosine(37)-C(2))-methylthiotransferase MtaB [Ehrlichia ruminantium]QGR03745.1 tRNA (N(6)-L-threonylcarbamoyladenosine(37)-C(2))-methylthiotransferase MtaB [Ehrlichia ruminantium]QGR04672.1 tRNA (N(6)-L-threonylcarbamoyladenosine(37)-C(2))-methylthiotransferase MtaB [Ehrlichia ruminantium]
MSEVITFGCRLNFYESEVIKNNLKKAKLNDVVVVHTCSVTSQAERQVQAKIRKLYNDNTNVKIIVAGCAAQLNPEVYMKMPGVIKVLGNEDKLKYESYITNDKVIVGDIDSSKAVIRDPIAQFSGKSRALIEIQNGCNHECTFCVITKARGNNRSLHIEDIISQVKDCVNNGYNEVVFTGVDISDFGVDIYGQRVLGVMIKRVLDAVPKLRRLRLSSIDVAEIEDDLIDIIGSEPRFMPHLHLSLQSGNNLILKRMKRRHNRDQVLEFCNRVSGIRKDVVFGADIIVGFPTETDDMFNDTVSLIEEANISYLHIFPYSIREGTPAARMPQVLPEVKKKRTKCLCEIAEKRLHSFYNTLLHTKQSIVVEKEGTGRAENFALVKFFNQNVQLQSVVEVVIKKVERNYLIAEVI